MNKYFYNKKLLLIIFLIISCAVPLIRFYIFKVLLCIHFIAIVGLFYGIYKKSFNYLKAFSLIIFIVLFSPIPRFFLYQLEHFHQNYEIKNEDEIAGLILLGGYFHLGEDLSTDKRPIYNLAAGRFSEFVSIARKYKGLPIILTGTKEESGLTLKLFEEMGIDKNRVRADFNAKNTIDNAKNAFTLLNDDEKRSSKPFLLVTSAFHMPRSMILFKNTGINIKPYSVDYHTRTSSIFKMWLLSFDNMNAICYYTVLKELVAILNIKFFG